MSFTRTCTACGRVFGRERVRAGRCEERRDGTAAAPGDPPAAAQAAEVAASAAPTPAAPPEAAGAGPETAGGGPPSPLSARPAAAPAAAAGAGRDEGPSRPVSEIEDAGTGGGGSPPPGEARAAQPALPRAAPGDGAAADRPAAAPEPRKDSDGGGFPSADAANRGAAAPSEAPRLSAPARVCAHPGCDVALSPRNTVGVCRDHNHGEACRCARCLERRRPRCLDCGADLNPRAHVQGAKRCHPCAVKEVAQRNRERAGRAPAAPLVQPGRVATAPAVKALIAARFRHPPTCDGEARIALAVIAGRPDAPSDLPTTLPDAALIAAVAKLARARA